jgi:hypothetical protein
MCGSHRSAPGASGGTTDTACSDRSYSRRGTTASYRGTSARRRVYDSVNSLLYQFEALVSLGNGGRVTYRVRLTTLLGRVSHTIEEQYGDQRMHALPWLAYGLRMTQVDPLRSSRNDSTQLFCATCGHSEAAHSNSGDRRCLRSICSCHKFIVGAVVDLTAQVLSS